MAIQERFTTGPPPSAAAPTPPDVALLSLRKCYGDVAAVDGSGYGKDLSVYSLEEYTQIKHVMAKLD